MTKPTIFEVTSVPNHDRFLIAVFFAAVVHMLIVLGVAFEVPKMPVQSSRSIDVILVNEPIKKTPQKANYLAQENQVGGGEKLHKPRPQAQRIANEGDSPKKHTDKIDQEEAIPKAKRKLVTQKSAPKKIVAEQHHEETKDEEHRPKLTAEMLQQQIAQLGNEIRLKQQSSDDTRIKSVNSVSTHKFVAAQYVKDWETKVERTGNLNYPEIATKKNFSGTLTMDVGIKANGSIHSIRITRPSGYPELDEAAKKIVRMSAPFAALPSDLLKELNVLVITRKWKFSDESGMTTP